MRYVTDLCSLAKAVASRLSSLFFVDKAMHNGHVAAACRAFAKVKRLRMSKSAPGVCAIEDQSPRTPLASGSTCLDAHGGLSPSPSMQRLSLLGKADAQNIEIQLKGIKLRLPAITAVRREWLSLGRARACKIDA